MRNPIAKHMHKANCYGKTEPNKRDKLLSETQRREALESVSEAKIDGKYEKFNEEEE
ncbi:hypothetical protein D3C85_1531950 [compost metagenome]